MEKILIIGHKSPDTDSVTSAVVMENLEKKLGLDNVVACRQGKLNKETKFVFDYLQMEEPMLIEKVEDGQDVILVDHNECDQCVENIENAHILKVIDHHRICSFKTSDPLYYRAEPVGCTATILYKLYQENEVEIEPKIALLMLSAIISDTLLFKSPTCTKQDKEIAEKLASIAGIDVEQYGLEMLKAGTDLSDLTVEELLSLDAKVIMLKEVKSLIAQVNTASIEDTLTRKAEIESKMQEKIEKDELGIFVFVVTDIINSNSQAIVLGDRSDIFEKAFVTKLDQNTAFLPGVVSRKKQIVPVMTENA